MTEQNKERPVRRGRAGRRKKLAAIIVLVLAAVLVVLYFLPADLYIDVYGNVLSAKYAALRAGSKGPIEAVMVESGQRVRKDDIILKLESEVEQSDVVRCQRELEAAKAELNFLAAQLQVERRHDEIEASFAKIKLTDAETDYKRIKTLHEKDAASDREYEEASVAYRLAQATYERLSIDRSDIHRTKLVVQEKKIATIEAELARAEGTLATRTVRAPLAGLIVLHALSVGRVVDADEVLGQIFDDRSYQVVARVPERYVEFIQEGQCVNVELSAYPQYDSGEVMGTVTSIVQVIQPHASGEGTFRIHAELTAIPKNVRLTSGMSAELEIAAGKTTFLRKVIGMLPHRYEQVHEGEDATPASQTPSR